MEKIAFVFPGQGVQFVGMSKKLCEEYRVADETFSMANSVLGKDIRKICFEGSLTALNDLENLFPIILTNGVATYNAFMQDIGIRPQFCVGHSLGEITALVCAGVLDFSDALALTALRGRLAKQVADNGKTGMTILDKVPYETIEAECAKIRESGFYAAVSCYNTPQQTAVSGETEALKQLEKFAIKRHGTVNPIYGGAPLHSTLMNGVAEDFAADLEGRPIHPFLYPVVFNTTAQPSVDPAGVRGLMVRQLYSPVLWQSSLELLVRYGINVLIEMGPKPVWQNDIKLFYPDVHTFCFGQQKDREEFRRFLNGKPHLLKEKGNLITRCLAAAVSTPNANWDNEAYREGVVRPYEEICKIDLEVEKCGGTPTPTQTNDAMAYIRQILDTKKVAPDEKTYCLGGILNQAGYCGLARTAFGKESQCI